MFELFFHPIRFLMRRLLLFVVLGYIAAHFGLSSHAMTALRLVAHAIF